MKITTNPQGPSMEAVTKKLDLIFCELQSLTQAVKALTIISSDAKVQADVAEAIDVVNADGIRRSDCTEVKNAIDTVCRTCLCKRSVAREALNAKLSYADRIRFDGDTRTYILKGYRDKIVPEVIAEIGTQA